MSAVLDIDNLLESPLADLHAIAGELEIEDYRKLGKPELTVAILEHRGLGGDEVGSAVEAKSQQLAEQKAAREQELAEAEEAAEAAREAARQEQASERARGGGRSRGGRGGRGGRDARGRDGREGGSREGGRGGSREGGQGKGQPRGRGDRQGSAAGERSSAQKTGQRGEQQARPKEPATPLAGVFEPGSGGGGRLRTDLTRRVRGDADVPRGEVRRWNLKKGDLINAQVNKSRRGRTDFVVNSIDSVNGLDQAARKQPAPSFEQRDAAAVGARYAKRTFKHAPIGAGSRLAVTGPTRAAASEMLKKLAGELAGEGVVTTLVVVSARPEQSESINGVEVILGDASKAPDGVLPALELAIERDRRLAETGRHTAILVDGLDLLEAAKAAEIFSSARNLAGGGSLTTAAAVGSGSSLEALATAIGVVAGGRKLKLDKKSSWAG